ncbi:MAG: hypothetical protein AAF281_10260 [Pseudomonadota bacterium]
MANAILEAIEIPPIWPMTGAGTFDALLFRAERAARRLMPPGAGYV